MREDGTVGAGLDPRDIDYRALVDAVTDYAIFALDPDGHILSWNAGARRIKGYEAHEVIGRHFSLFYPPEMIARGWPEHELRVAKESGRFEDEGWRLRKDGTRFWANVIITRMLDPEGAFRGFFKISCDLTERRNQMEMLRLSEERFRLLVEGVRDYAIFMLDPAGFVVSWNAGACQTKGYSAEEIIGRHFSVFYPPDVAASGWPENELRRALADGRYEEEGWRVRKDGTRFWASVVITALHDESGAHVGFAKVTRDLTERRRIATLEDEGRRVSRFLAMLGHELRNPLAPISYALAAMEREPGRSAATEKLHGVVRRQFALLAGLVDELLEVARITNGKIHLELRPTSLQAAIAQATEAIEPLFNDRSQRLEVKLPDEVLWVEGDHIRLVQIIGNLLGNASKFTPHGGGHVLVTLTRVQTMAELSVKDNGWAIPPALLPNMFKLFVQGDQDPSRSHGGLGLGLTLVQELARLHGGDVAAFSDGIAGHGSEFVVRLPLIPPPPPVGEVKVTAPPRQRARGKLLVVDDNRDAADMLALLLADDGYEVKAIYSAREAIEEATRNLPDAIVLDLGLPEMSGIDVAKAIRADEAGRRIVLIALTGYGSSIDREATAEAGFAAHLTKPSDHGELTRQLETLLKGAGPASA